MARPIVLVLLAALTACSGPPEEPEISSSVSIVARPNATTARVGVAVRFVALLERRDGAEPVAAQWSSRDPRIATIDPSTGVAVGLAPGRVAIEAHYGPGVAAATLDVVP